MQCYLDFHIALSDKKYFGSATWIFFNNYSTLSSAIRGEGVIEIYWSRIYLLDLAPSFCRLTWLFLSFPQGRYSHSHPHHTYWGGKTVRKVHYVGEEFRGFHQEGNFQSPNERNLYALVTNYDFVSKKKHINMIFKFSLIQNEEERDSKVFCLFRILIVEAVVKSTVRILFSQLCSRLENGIN